MGRIFATLIFIAVFFTSAVRAQDSVFIQVEAHPSLATAEDRARAYAARIDLVNGFALGSGWYGIALGPFAQAEAERELAVLRSSGDIPSDSYIVEPSRYGQQFWPVGGAVLSTLAVTSTSTETAAAQPAPEPEDESPREARASEAALTKEERMLLQTALKWAGFYNSAIDGAFGRGTRGSMADWQGAQGYETTGILTTRQRAELLRQYNSVLEGMGLTTVADSTAGIEMLIPTGVVRFDRYDYPFAHFTATTDLGVQVYLISQAGDEATLFGLYDIMETLEIVPLEGERERSERGFILKGANDRIVSHTEVSLQNGEIKGFTLVWPAGDEERRSRVLAEMLTSFTRIDGVLDPGAGSNAAQNIDLVSGLEIRRPAISRSGFYADGNGTVITTTEAIEGQCTRITLDDEFPATLVARDDVLGLAVLRPEAPLSPLAAAKLLDGTPRIQSDVAVSGYSFGGALNAPTLTYGTLADIKGLDGDTRLRRLALAPLPGDAGGPVLDDSGAVIGMLLPSKSGSRQLPQDVSFAMDAATIGEFLARAQLPANKAESGPALDPVELTRLASGMTVLVSCWN